jgi:hypothetical protein
MMVMGCLLGSGVTLLLPLAADQRLMVVPLEQAGEVFEGGKG